MHYISSAIILSTRTTRQTVKETGLSKIIPMASRTDNNSPYPGLLTNFASYHTDKFY